MRDERTEDEDDNEPEANGGVEEQSQRTVRISKQAEPEQWVRKRKVFDY